MRKYLLLFAFTPCFCKAQLPNSVKLSASSPAVYFGYSNANELSQLKVTSNPVELRVKVKDEPINVFASIDFDGVPYQKAEKLANLMFLQLKSHTSYNGTPKAEVMLSTNDVLLISQPPVANAEHFFFYYNVAMKPITQFVPAGDYSFTLNFTMTAP